MPAQKPYRSKQDYATPKNFLEAVKLKLRISDFCIDLAADGTNSVAGANFFNKADDSLSRDWRARVGNTWAWLNPPFTDIEPWAEKCAIEGIHGARIALLVPASVGANWFRDYVDEQARVLFLNGRLCFIQDWATTLDPGSLKPGKGPPRCYTSPPLYPKDCILALYSPDIAPGYEVWTWNRANQKPRPAPRVSSGVVSQAA